MYAYGIIEVYTGGFDWVFRNASYQEARSEIARLKKMDPGCSYRIKKHSVKWF